MRVGPKGQVVIPKRIRERLGIKPGDEVRVSDADGEVRVRRVLSLDELRGILGPPTGMEDWEEEKRRERELEERKWERMDRWLNQS